MNKIKKSSPTQTVSGWESYVSFNGKIVANVKGETSKKANAMAKGLVHCLKEYPVTFGLPYDAS